jgi:hypothetical protein
VKRSLILFTPKVCGGGTHPDYERRTSNINCEIIANFFVTKFELKLLPNTDFSGEIAKAERENEPEEAEREPIQ